MPEKSHFYGIILLVWPTGADFDPAILYHWKDGKVRNWLDGSHN